ncbi:hypothetical protein C8R44DRAFT_869661 [Mycena epipterygia]|nr:hypothetical protein C8R44DRAFT_869661 [Mycena epipterygia]
MPTLTGEKITVSTGLDGLDDYFETLMYLWEDMQLCSLDAAAQPQCDLLSFAQSAFFLGIVTLNTPGQVAPLDLNQVDSKLRDGMTPTEEQGYLRTSPKVVETPSAQRARSWIANTRPPAAAMPAGPDPETDATDHILDDLLGEYNLNNTWKASRRDRRKNPKLTWDDTPNTWDAPNTHPAESYISGFVNQPNTKETHSNLQPYASPSRTSSLRYELENPYADGSIFDQYQGPSTGITSLWNNFTRRASESNETLASKITPFPHVDSSIRPVSRSLWSEDDELSETIEASAAKKIIGIIYLAASPFSDSPVPGQIGELNLGIVLHAAHRRKGYAREAIQLVVKHAFDDRHCHRIQASLLQLSSKDRMTSLLTQMRFGHEGTKRRSFFNPMMGEWQDVTTLAILDTDWAMRTFYKPAPKSLWDELFLRHERERDELLRWEETQNRLKRTSSMETLRAVPVEPDSNSSDAVSSSSASSANKGKKRAAASHRDPYDGSSSDADSDFSDARIVRRHIAAESGLSSPTLSVASLESIPRSITPSGSEWDMLDSSSSGSSSFSDLE